MCVLSLDFSIFLSFSEILLCICSRCCANVCVCGGLWMENVQIGSKQCPFYERNTIFLWPHFGLPFSFDDEVYFFYPLLFLQHHHHHLSLPKNQPLPTRKPFISYSVLVRLHWLCLHVVVCVRILYLYVYNSS